MQTLSYNSNITHDSANLIKLNLIIKFVEK